MKKLMKTLAVVLAFVLAVDAPVSASTAAAGTAGTTAESLVPGQLMGTGDGGTGDRGTGDKGTGDKKDPSGTSDGDGSTWDGADQVLAVAIKGDKVLNVEAGDAVSLEANVITNNECVYTVDWSVEGDAVIVSGEEGDGCTLAAVSGGSAVVTVTATGSHGSKSDSVTVNVKEYVEEMHFASDTYNGFNVEDNTGDIRFCVKHKVDMSEELVKDPATATDTITYSVNNKSVATVDASGVLTLKKKGDVVLTAVSEQGVKAKTTIHVTEGNPVKKITIKQVVNGTNTDIAKKKLTLAEYEAMAALVVEVEGKDNTKPVTDELTWTSAKPAIVKLVGGVSNGKTQTLTTDLEDTVDIQACGVGSSKITVKSSGGKSANITVTAQAPTRELQFVDENGDVVTEGETYPLKKITLQLARDPEVSKDKIEWSVTPNDKKKVTVSGKKNDTALVTVKLKKLDATATEKFTITAKVKGSDVKAEYELTVKPSEITKLTAADNMKTELSVGEQTKYSVNIEGTGTAEEITWSSSNTKVLSIDQDGHATALKAGKATVKAVATDVSGKTGKATTVTYKVNVTQPVTAISMKKDMITVAAGKKKTVSLAVVQEPKGTKKAQIEYQITYKDCADASISNNKVTVPASAKPGNVIVVEAKVKNTNITAYATIQVIGKKATLTFNNTKITNNKLNLYVGDRENLRAELTQAEGESPWIDTITYSVSKKGIVAVDKAGNVTALQPGTVTVTAKTLSGAKKTVKVTVTEEKPSTETQDGGTGDKK